MDFYYDCRGAKGMKERETICVVYLLLQLALIKTVFVNLYIIVL